MDKIARIVKVGQDVVDALKVLHGASWGRHKPGICQHCDALRAWEKETTPEYECPEGPKTARLYTVGSELRMLTPDQVEDWRRLPRSEVDGETT